MGDETIREIRRHRREIWRNLQNQIWKAKKAIKANLTFEEILIRKSAKLEINRG